MKLRDACFGLLTGFFCIRCAPNFDQLSSGHGGGGAGQAGGGTSAGGAAGASGKAGSGGSQSTTSGAGGAVAGASGDAGQAGSSSGSSGAGGSQAGAGQGGSVGGAGDAGASGSGGSVAGSGAAGASGASGAGGSGGGSAGAGASGAGGSGAGGSGAGGTSGAAGAAGGGPTVPCTDGCALLDIPYASANQSQFVTININLSTGVDLSDSVVTAHVRAVGFTGTTETIQLYASAVNFAFWGNGNVKVPLSTLGSGGTLTMDLTSTVGWDNTKVISLGFLLNGAATVTPVQILVDEILVTVKANPQATPKAGSWFFTQMTDVNSATADTISTTFSTPNVIFANPYNPVIGAKVDWVPPGGADGGA